MLDPQVEINILSIVHLLVNSNLKLYKKSDS